MQDTIGVDVSKDCLDAYHAGASNHRAFSNDASGLTALCRWVREQGDVLVVFEASGAYHRGLEQVLARRGLPFAKVNPRQARRFAEAIGQVAKTDRVPSRDIALQCTAGRGMPRFWPGWGWHWTWHRVRSCPNM